jgi:hypothetical protein
MPTRIPPFTFSGVLPPFTSQTPIDAAFRAPYVTDVGDLCSRFGGSAHRAAVLQRFLEHRAALNALGFVNGFQWCDGSFVEDKDPSDMDVVVFVHPPGELSQLVQQHLHLFDPALTRQKYNCDGYFVDLSLPPEIVVERTHYWFGLFSHRRVTAEWKGLVQVPLCTPGEDATAFAALQQAMVQQ